MNTEVVQNTVQGMRLDAALVSRGMASSREQAKRHILAGEIYINDKPAKKASAAVFENDILRLEGICPRYVGRGGYKLEKAIDLWKIDLDGLTAMDIGASTGGFTDCMLQHGAQRVYSVDVGHGQLHAKLTTDDRVYNLEKTDIRNTDFLKEKIKPESVDFCSIDVSFISLKKILVPALCFLKPDALIVCLIKPQFEAGRQAIGKKGVVKDKKAHKAVLDDLYCFFHSEGCTVLNLEYSPVTGGEGNIEYLALLTKSRHDFPPVIQSESVVEEAHRVLRG